MMKLWAEVERLFNQVLELPVSEREAFLQKACSGDEELRAEVESLLEYHERSDGLFETPAIEQEAKKIADETLQDSSGKRIGPYLLLSLLGVGGMASVYRARDERTGEEVALKLLSVSLAEDKYRLRRFHREAKALRGLVHGNVARLYEAGEADGQHFIAMELVQGVSLEEMIRSGEMSFDQVLGIAIQVVEALKDAHDHGVIHRDIKPSNLIVQEHGQVKVLDFGLAKALGHAGASSALDMSLESLTTTGTVLGTVDYMSPEQIKGVKLDHRTDIFAVGALIYQMLTGRLPFQGKNFGDTIRRVLEEPPAPMTRGDDSAPSDVQGIVLTCMQKKPERRYQSATELLKDLRLAAGMDPSEVRVRRWWKWRK
jgi:serine/threonine protein kinase